MNPKALTMVGDYIRAVAVAVLTLVASGVFDARTMAIGAAASLLPLLARGVNPNDEAYGRVTDSDG